MIEPHSPYYLHPSKGPGVMITAVGFDGKNYGLCERAVRTTLKAKNKLVSIDGSLTRPDAKEGEEFSECHTWDTVNCMFCLWILNVIDPKLHIIIAYSDIAHAMLNDLKKRYETANTLRIYQLMIKADIANCK